MRSLSPFECLTSRVPASKSTSAAAMPAHSETRSPQKRMSLNAMRGEPAMWGQRRSPPYASMAANSARVSSGVGR